MSYEYRKQIWWWDALIDWMVANPGSALKEVCASNGGPLDIHYATVLNVTQSDLFKARLAQRKTEISQGVDLMVISKTTKIASLGLDAIQNVLEKKRGQIPLEELQAVTTSALDRLGYGAKPPAGGAAAGVSVHLTQNVTNVDAGAVANARALLRAKEQELARLPAPQSESIVNIEMPGEEPSPSLALEGEIVDLEALDVSE